MKIIQELLHKMSFGTLSPQPSRPLPTTPEQWRTYWESQGQPWRREPEIDLQRQAELAQRRAIVPDITLGIYPFKGVKLSRADVEWLLATHDGGRGPVNWNDKQDAQREGLDLRGANLDQADLHSLPLARLRGGLSWNEWFQATEEQRKRATLHMDGANVVEAQLNGANLVGARLNGADLRWAQLGRANLRRVQLNGANLTGAQLEETSLNDAQLVSVNLREAHLDGAALRDIVLSDNQHIGPRLADAHWGSANLAVVDWSQVMKLGDEHQAQQKRRSNREKKVKAARLREYNQAVRANRQLAVALQAQGLNEQAARFAYRAQALQRRVFWFEMVQQRVKLRQRGQALAAWLFSWFLFLLAGYGYKPARSFLVYLLVIVGFSTLYLGLGGHLAWYEAGIVSMTAFHGRGFSPSTFSPGDPLSIASAFEAFVGLIIEVTFIATLTQRFFNK